MARDYDRSEAFPSLGARSDTGTLFGPTMVLVAVTVALFTLGACRHARIRRRLGHDEQQNRTIRLAVAAMASEVAIAATEPS
jgi:hypothetical protein